MVYWIPTAVIAVYIAALFVVTWWSQRLVKRSSSGMLGYFLAGRQFPAWVAAAALTGLAVGGASTVGVAEQAYKLGFSAGWYNAAWAVGAIITGLLVAGRYRKLEITTIPEFLERYYDTRGRVLGVIGQLAIQIVITSLQYVAGGAVLSSLMPGLFTFQTGMLVTAIVFVGITLIGGFWAAGLTNVINVIVIYVGVGLGAVMTVGKLGGLGELVAHLPADHPGFDLWAVGPGMIAAWFLVMVTTVLSTQSVVQVGFAAKDGRAARNGFLLGGLLILPVGFVSALIGMAAAGIYPGIVPAEALPRAVLDLPPLAAGMILAGLWAADVSTASALLVGSATLISTDIVKRFISQKLTESQEWWLSRASVGALSIITYLLATFVSGILKVLLVGLTLATAYTLVVLMTLFFPRLCRRSSATWTLAATMVSLALWLVAPPEWRVLPHPIYFTWLTSLVAFFLVAVVDRRQISVGGREASARKLAREGAVAAD